MWEIVVDELVGSGFDGRVIFRVCVKVSDGADTAYR